MTVAISMFRGVHLGPHRRIKMDALRNVHESLGLRDAQTYVQSGNVIFGTKERDLDRLARRIEDAFEQAFGFRSDCIIRSAAEMRKVVAQNPFAGRADIEPGKLLVTFLNAEPSAEARDRLLAVKTDPEVLHLRGREIYIYFPNGQGRSKLSWPVLEKALKTTGTGRNWNSVTKMLEVAEKLES